MVDPPQWVAGHPQRASLWSSGGGAATTGKNRGEYKKKKKLKNQIGGRPLTACTRPPQRTSPWSSGGGAATLSKIADKNRGGYKKKI